MKDKRFIFHKIDNGIESGWVCLVSSSEAFFDVIDKLNKDSFAIYKKIQDSNPDVIGHAGSQEASQIKILLGMEMEKNCLDSLGGREVLNFIMDLKTKSFINVFMENGEAYINGSGGVRPSTNLSPNERIIDVCYSDLFVFPDADKSNIKIEKWPMGKHYYLLDNGEMVSIDGMDKWNTMQGAERAKEKYINSHVKH